MSMPSSEELFQFVKGDVTGLEKFISLEHEKLKELYLRLSPIIVTREYVENVLKRLRAGKIKQVDVQQWASFIRRGYFPSMEKKSISPIELEYKVEDEDWIVDVIARLDELGDEIDGKINNTEIDEILCR